MALGKKAVAKKYRDEICPLGGRFLNFNFPKGTSPGLKGEPDHRVIYSNLMVYIEVKIGDDELSIEQIDCAKALFNVCDDTETVFYIIDDGIITEKIIDAILGKNLVWLMDRYEVSKKIVYSTLAKHNSLKLKKMKKR